MVPAEARTGGMRQQAEQLFLLRRHGIEPPQRRQPAPCVQPQQGRRVQHQPGFTAGFMTVTNGKSRAIASPVIGRLT